MFAVVVLIGCPHGASVGLGQVVFDVNGSAPVRTLCADTSLQRSPNTRLVSVELELSTLFQPGVSDSIKEVMIQAVCRREDVVVVDYFPRTEMQTDIEGIMQVSQESDRARDIRLQGAGGYPGIGSISGGWNQTEFQTQNIQFAKRPAREVTVASGTTNRQRGVYFKMRPTTQTTLEGSKTLGLVLSVPENWRADLMDVTVQAAGVDPLNNRREGVVARQVFVVALFQERDEVASRVASEYVKQQSNLIRSAKTFSKAIEQRKYPTPLHKLGAKLDLYEPELPGDWLELIVYQPGGYHHTRLSTLPVDLRVAVMNFQDQKGRMELLSGANPRPSSAPSNPSLAGEPQTVTVGYRGPATTR